MSVSEMQFIDWLVELFNHPYMTALGTGLGIATAIMSLIISPSIRAIKWLYEHRDENQSIWRAFLQYLKFVREDLSSTLLIIWNICKSQGTLAVVVAATSILPSLQGGPEPALGLAWAAIMLLNMFGYALLGALAVSATLRISSSKNINFLSMIDYFGTFLSVLALISLVLLAMYLVSICLGHPVIGCVRFQASSFSIIGFIRLSEFALGGSFAIANQRSSNPNITPLESKAKQGTQNNQPRNHKSPTKRKKKKQR